MPRLPKRFQEADFIATFRTFAERVLHLALVQAIWDANKSDGEWIALVHSELSSGSSGPGTGTPRLTISRHFRESKRSSRGHCAACDGVRGRPQLAAARSNDRQTQASCYSAAGLESDNATRSIEDDNHTIRLR